MSIKQLMPTLRPRIKKLIFFYCLIHLIALFSFLFNIHPSITSHSLNEQQRQEVQKRWEAKEFESKLRQQREEDQLWDRRFRVVKKYLGEDATLSRDRESYLFRIMVRQTITAYNKSKYTTDEDEFVVKDLKLLAEDPRYRSGMGTPSIYFNPNDPSYEVDRIKKVYILTSDRAYNQDFWPFSRYTQKWYEFKEYNLTVFLGIFSGYDFSEFSFYVLLPVLLLLIIRFYKVYITK